MALRERVARRFLANFEFMTHKASLDRLEKVAKTLTRLRYQVVNVKGVENVDRDKTLAKAVSTLSSVRDDIEGVYASLVKFVDDHPHVPPQMANAMRGLNERMSDAKHQVDAIRGYLADPVAFSTGYYLSYGGPKDSLGTLLTHAEKLSRQAYDALRGAAVTASSIQGRMT